MARRHFLATLILQVIEHLFLFVVLFPFVCASHQEYRVLIVSMVIGSILLVSVIQFFGWNGYRHESINYVHVTTVFRCVSMVIATIAVLSFFQTITISRPIKDEGKWTLEFTANDPSLRIDDAIETWRQTGIRGPGLPRMSITQSTTYQLGSGFGCSVIMVWLLSIYMFWASTGYLLDLATKRNKLSESRTTMMAKNHN